MHATTPLPRRRVRWYAAAARRLERGPGPARSLVRALALGSFDAGDLRTLDELYYAGAVERVGSEMLPYTHEGYITSGLFAWERQAFQAHAKPGGRVVVVGAGSGREVLGLLELGYEAIGYEPNDELRAAGIEVLRTRGHEGRLLPAPRDVMPAEAPSCDAVLLGWAMIMLVCDAVHRRRLLEQARARLPRDGMLLMSYWRREPEAVAPRAVHRVASTLRRLRRAEPVERGDLLAPNFVHLFTDDEVHRLLAQAGFAPAYQRAEPYPHAVALAV